MQSKSTRILLALIILPFAGPALAQQISGPAEVVDGDSLTVAGRPIRLFGIDAPEGNQTCERGGAQWHCGEESANQLRSLIEGHDVHCQGQGVDQYGRVLAVCSSNGFDLNRTMVEAGWATAFQRYSEDYVTAEVRAKAAKLGLWSSIFDLPEVYRMQQEAPAPKEAPARVAPRRAQSQAHFEGCVIKGNRNRRGQWIYHLPGMPYYNVTRAEEMFCTEADAQAAGYRRAIVR
jgi:endonuclease YncB( thermonuclease family)